MPSVDEPTIELDLDTATYSPFAKVTPVHLALAGKVLVVQVMPSVEVAAVVVTEPSPETATKERDVSAVLG